MKKATHKGHCQVCGKIQALPFNGKLSLHGYTVAGFGFFNGVCHGARRLPLQQERTITDQIIVSLGQYADAQDKAAAEFTAGTRLPRQARSGKYVKVTKTNRRGCWESSEPELVDFELAPVEYQQREVKICIAECESQARQARSHARDMKALADKIHGTALILITDEVKAPVVKPTVDVKAGKVTGTYATKAARKDDLDALNRRYEKLHNQIQDAYLTSDLRDNAEATEIYYGPYQLNNWRPKHSAAVRKIFPQLETIVSEIEQLVVTRTAVKEAK